MGHSEEKKTWWGDKYTAHFDDDGNEIGRSEEKTGWFGQEYTQHYDADGNKSGTSEERTDWLGDKYTQHFDTDDNKAGTSEERTDWLGDKYTQHYDAQGSKAGTSEQRTNWLGERFTQHSGEAFAASRGSLGNRESAGSEETSGSSRGKTGRGRPPRPQTSHSVGCIGVAAIVLVALVAVSIIADALRVHSASAGRFALYERQLEMAYDALRNHDFISAEQQFDVAREMVQEFPRTRFEVPYTKLTINAGPSVWSDEVTLSKRWAFVGVYSSAPVAVDNDGVVREYTHGSTRMPVVTSCFNCAAAFLTGEERDRAMERRDSARLRFRAIGSEPVVVTVYQLKQPDVNDVKLGNPLGRDFAPGQVAVLRPSSSTLGGLVASEGHQEPRPTRNTQPTQSDPVGTGGAPELQRDTRVEESPRPQEPRQLKQTWEELNRKLAETERAVRGTLERGAGSVKQSRTPTPANPIRLRTGQSHAVTAGTGRWSELITFVAASDSKVVYSLDRDDTEVHIEANGSAVLVDPPGPFAPHLGLDVRTLRFRSEGAVSVGVTVSQISHRTQERAEERVARVEASPTPAARAPVTIASLCASEAKGFDEQEREFVSSPHQVYAAVLAVLEESEGEFSVVDAENRCVVTKLKRHGMVGFPHCKQYYAIVQPAGSGGSRLQFLIARYWVNAANGERKPEESQSVLRKSTEKFIERVEEELNEPAEKRPRRPREPATFD